MRRFHADQEFEASCFRADDYASKFTWGLKQMDALNDNMGVVYCKEGRVVAFPNILLRRLQV